jgi:hypothetical protein
MVDYNVEKEADVVFPSFSVTRLRIYKSYIS